MIVNAEITGVELRKTKAGGRAVNVAFKTDSTDKKYQWVRDFIGESAPGWVANRWWALINQELGWEGFSTLNSFDLVGVQFGVELEWDEKYKRAQVKAFVNSAATTETSVPTNGFAPPPTSGFAPPPPAPTPPTPPAPQVVPQDDIPF